MATSGLPNSPPIRLAGSRRDDARSNQAQVYAKPVGLRAMGAAKGGLCGPFVALPVIVAGGVDVVPAEVGV